MKKGTLFLQLTAGALFIGLLALIVSSKFLVGDRDPGAGTGDQLVQGAEPGPKDESRVFFANIDHCLLVLAPLQLQPGRRKFDRRWLNGVLGGNAAEESFLVLHLIGRGSKSGFRYDAARDRIELEFRDGETGRDVPLASRLARVELSDRDGLLLRTFMPNDPLDLPANGLATVLLCFPAKDAWTRLVAARLYRPGAKALELRSAAVTQLEWESLLSGGPIPEVPFAAGPEAAGFTGRRGE